MDELIKIEEKDGIQTVNARDLWRGLESKSQFADWIKSRIEKFDFVEGQDFVKASEKNEASATGQTVKEYYISIDMAKELAMVENNDLGRKYRRYFIACEQRLKAIAAKPAGGIGSVLHAMVDQLEAQEKRLTALEERQGNSDEFYSIKAYCNVKKIKASSAQMAQWGKQAAALSRGAGIMVGKVPDACYGAVGTYHADILEELFETIAATETN